MFFVVSEIFMEDLDLRMEDITEQTQGERGVARVDTMPFLRFQSMLPRFY